MLATHNQHGRARRATDGSISFIEKHTGGSSKAKLAPDSAQGPGDDNIGRDSDMQEVEKLKLEAVAMKEKAEETMEAAKEAEKDAQGKLDDATGVQDTAEERLEAAEDMKQKAAGMHSQAKQAEKDAEQLEKDAKEAVEEAGELQKEAKEAEKEAAGLQKEADKIKKGSKVEAKRADHVKDDARKELLKHRECVDFPGIRMHEGENVIFEAEGDDSIPNAKSCNDKCLENNECRQSVWIGWKSACTLYGDALADPVEFRDHFNSSFCGFVEEHDQIMEMLDKVYAQVPYIPPLQECSWAGEDCSATNCCNDVYCNKDFSECRGYACYRQDEYFAGCLLDPPDESWDGEIIGGPRETREIPAASEGVKLQGTTLFCFMVINWDAPAPKSFWATEAELANHIKENKLSIWQCDDGEYFAGYQTPKAEWGSFSNIDAFANVWKDVKADGRWINYDWTVKVDADAVFIPERLKQHIEKLRTPRNSRVYLKNINYQFQMMGALEVFTREALEVYFEKGDTCIRGEHEGGEDRFMQLCMDSLGVDHQTDHELLRDKYCLTCPDRDDGCTDGWVAAYHFHKKVISWDWCYNEVVCGEKAGDCDDGIAVEFVMEDDQGRL